ncbi:MAG: DUF2905 domain-containing protein [Dehalococcoidia bacterium]
MARWPRVTGTSNGIATLGRLLIVIAMVTLALGVVVLLLGRVPFIGRLPGDLTFRRDGLTVFFPFVTMILLSVLLTVVFNVVARWFR